MKSPKGGSAESAWDVVGAWAGKSIPFEAESFLFREGVAWVVENARSALVETWRRAILCVYCLKSFAETDLCTLRSLLNH